MIRVNNKEYNWTKGMNLYDVFRVMGYTLQKPSVLVHVNGEVVKKDRWDNYYVADESVIEVVNLLRGG